MLGTDHILGHERQPRPHLARHRETSTGQRFLGCLRYYHDGVRRLPQRSWSRSERYHASLQGPRGRQHGGHVARDGTDQYSQKGALGHGNLIQVSTRGATSGRGALLEMGPKGDSSLAGWGLDLRPLPWCREPTPSAPCMYVSASIARTWMIRRYINSTGPRRKISTASAATGDTPTGTETIRLIVNVWQTLIPHTGMVSLQGRQ